MKPNSDHTENSGQTDPGSPAFRRAQGEQSAGETPRSGSGPRIRPFLTEDQIKAKRRPEPVQEIVDRFMTGIGGGGAAPAAALGARWSEVVGDEFVAKTAPGSCESGRLVVLVRDGATASKMRFRTSQILQEVTKIVGDGVVASISFRVSPSVGRKPIA